MNLMELTNMQDGNRPGGLYGEVYDKQTGSKTRKVTEPYYEFAKWEAQVAQIALEEINKKLNLK
jgi:hypothetical protein